MAWNKLAEICGEYLTKGKLVYIEGSIRSRQWQDQAGNKRTAYEIIANQMQMLGSKGDSGGGAMNRPAQERPAPERFASPGLHQAPADSPLNPKSATRIFRFSRRLQIEKIWLQKARADPRPLPPGRGLSFSDGTCQPDAFIPTVLASLITKPNSLLPCFSDPDYLGDSGGGGPRRLRRSSICLT